MDIYVSFEDRGTERQSDRFVGTARVYGREFYGVHHASAETAQMRAYSRAIIWVAEACEAGEETVEPSDIFVAR